MEDTKTTWISRTMENMDKLLAAMKFDPGKDLDEFDPRKPSEIAKQEAYVEKSLERCPRCGDHIWGLIADPLNALSKLCSSCTTEVREFEKAHYRAQDVKPPLWFIDMVQLAHKKHLEKIGYNKKGGKS